MKNILLVGNFGSKNFGDELILRSAISVVRESGHEPWVVSADPCETSQAFGVKSFMRLPMGIRSFVSFRWMRTVGAFFHCDGVMFAGGGLFVDRFSLAKWIWGVHGFLALIMRKPLFLIGQSFEVRKKTTSWILRMLLRNAKLVTVRDHASLQYALSRGIFAEKVKIFPDMAFVTLLDTAKSLPSRCSGYAAVSLCQWGITDHDLELIAQKLHGYSHIRCFAFQEGRDDDSVTLRKLQALLPDKHTEIVSVNDPDFLHKFAACEFAITMRLHACIAAIAFRMPCVAIVYQDKVSNLMSDFGMSEACVRLGTTFEDDLSRALIFAESHQFPTHTLDLLSENTYALRALLISALRSL